MKIECNINNYLKTYNEVKGVVKSKNRILKNKNSNCLNNITRIIISLICLIILITYMNLSNILFLNNTSYILAFISSIYITFCIIYNIKIYSYRKKMNFQSTIVLNKEGLTDTSFQGIKMIFSWSKIKGIVIKKNSITILTDTTCYFYFDISCKEDILSALDKYATRDLIIE